METLNDCFVAALQKRLKEQGRGSKKKLAANVGVSPNHLSDILGQRKNASQKLKERIADALNMSFEDMLVLGRRIVEGREFVKKDQESTESLNQESKSNDEFLAIAAQILESGTPCRQALISNLTAFRQAIELGSKEAKALQMITSLQEEIKTIRQDVEGLKRSEDGEDDLPNTAVA
jgi:transcriptional regulator with XRE-family HTH domain